MFFVLVNYNNPILMLASQAKKVRYIETSTKESFIFSFIVTIMCIMQNKLKT